MSHKNIRDLTGQVFGRLTVKGDTGRRQNRQVIWSCICLCGNTTDAQGSHLRSGHTQSCGCYARQRSAEWHTKHGGAFTRLYRTWSSMAKRCANPNDKVFKNYGGRGISVCVEWRDDFAAFRAWAEMSGYEDHLTIDRIDVNGNYEPANCRWVTKSVQSQEHTRRLRPVICDDAAFFISINAAARGTNKGKIAIGMAARGNYKTAGGHRWRYATQDDLDIIEEMKRETL
jgi:hypothetical protein